MNDRSWMMKGMRENNNNEYTKSQMRVKEFLEQFFEVQAEKYINDLAPVDCIKPTVPPPRADIYIQKFDGGNYPLIIRVMGGIHEGRTQKMKDEDQRVVLEGNGYLVLDIWWDDFDELWNGTDEEAYEALVEYFNGDKDVLRE